MIKENFNMLSLCYIQSRRPLSVWKTTLRRSSWKIVNFAMSCCCSSERRELCMNISSTSLIRGDSCCLNSNTRRTWKSYGLLDSTRCWNHLGCWNRRRKRGWGERSRKLWWMDEWEGEMDCGFGCRCWPLTFVKWCYLRTYMYVGGRTYVYKQNNSGRNGSLRIVAKWAVLRIVTDLSMYI